MSSNPVGAGFGPKGIRSAVSDESSDRAASATRRAVRASVIIPAFNCRGVLAICLDALSRQTIPLAEFEIIVVDDGSTDGTEEVAASYPGVRVIRQRNRGPAAARNCGVRHAEAPIVVFTDSDCEPTPGWLEAMLEPFGDASVAGTKGAYRTRQRALIARFTQLEYEEKYDRMRRFRSIDFVDTYAAAFRRDVFWAAGGYDERFRVPSAEDVDLSFRLAAAGWQLIFVPEAIVFHRHPERLRNYLQRKYRYARWRVLAVWKTPGRGLRDTHSPMTNKMQILLVGGMAAAAVLWGLSPHGKLAFASAVAGFVASTVSFVIKAARRDWPLAVASPGLLFLRAVFQGAGLLHGVIDGLLRRRRP
jgi:GT2 family glycosyltransferase